MIKRKQPAFVVFIALALAWMGTACVKHPGMEQLKRATIHLYKQSPKGLNKRYKSISITRDTELKSIAGLISTTKAPLYKCSYDGEVSIVSKTGIVLTFEFNSSASCSHAVYMYKGDLRSYKLTPAGRMYLNQLVQKYVQTSTPKSTAKSKPKVRTQAKR